MLQVDATVHIQKTQLIKNLYILEGCCTHTKSVDRLKIFEKEILAKIGQKSVNIYTFLKIEEVIAFIRYIEWIFAWSCLQFLKNWTTKLECVIQILLILVVWSTR